MKRNYLFTAIAAAIFATALAPMSAIAAADCDAPKDNIERRACAKAAEGPDALRGFVWRTRMIYGLRYADFAPAIPANATLAVNAPLASSSK